MAATQCSGTTYPVFARPPCSTNVFAFHTNPSSLASNTVREYSGWHVAIQRLTTDKSDAKDTQSDVDAERAAFLRITPLPRGVRLWCTDVELRLSISKVMNRGCSSKLSRAGAVV